MKPLEIVTKPQMENKPYLHLHVLAIHLRPAARDSPGDVLLLPQSLLDNENKPPASFSFLSHSLPAVNLASSSLYQSSWWESQRFSLLHHSDFQGEGTHVGGC